MIQRTKFSLTSSTRNVTRLKWSRWRSYRYKILSLMANCKVQMWNLIHWTKIKSLQILMVFPLVGHLMLTWLLLARVHLRLILLLTDFWDKLDSYHTVISSQTWTSIIGTMTASQTWISIRTKSSVKSSLKLIVVPLRNLLVERCKPINSLRSWNSTSRSTD